MKLEKLEQWYEKSRRQVPCVSNRASQIGHPCLAYLYFARQNWKDKLPEPIWLLKAYRNGIEKETAIKNRLREAGYSIIKEQESFEWKEYQITGSIDGMIKGIEDDEHYYPFEVKSLSTFTCAKLKEYKDFFKSDKYYIRMYPYQLQCYLILAEKEKGYFIIEDNNSHDIEAIPVPLDYELAEEIIKKAEIVNNAILNNSVPAKINDAEICFECGFRDICQPSIIQEASKLDISGELDIILLQMEQLKEQIEPIEEKIKELEEKKKSILENIKEEKIITEHFFLQRKLINVKEKVIPANTYSRWYVKKLG